MNHKISTANPDNLAIINVLLALLNINFKFGDFTYICQILILHLL